MRDVRRAGRVTRVDALRGGRGARVGDVLQRGMVPRLGSDHRRRPCGGCAVLRQEEQRSAGAVGAEHVVRVCPGRPCVARRGGEGGRHGGWSWGRDRRRTGDSTAALNGSGRCGERSSDVADRGGIDRGRGGWEGAGGVA